MELENKIIAWFEGHLNSVDKKTLLKEVNASAEAKELFEMYQTIYQDFELEEMNQPSAEFKERFHASISNENKSKVKQLPSTTFLKYAAAILLLITVGILIGLNFSKNSEIDDLSSEIIALRIDMKVLLQNESTAQRIRAVKMSNDLETADSEVLEVLIKAMNSDKSDNVRLAAIDALEIFSHEKIVKKAFLQAFDQPQEDMIQIKLIRILAARKEKSALPYFDKIIDDKKTSKYVKTEATKGRKVIVNL